MMSALQIVIILFIQVSLSNKLPSPDDITDVYMVIMNHFDCGYNDPVIGVKSYAINVMNEYFDVYFPRAVNVGINITSTYNKTFKWTTQSWLISLYFDCPPFMGLHCPDQSAKQYILYGIKKQYIIWHSFPFNSQMEYYDPSLIQFGLKLSKDTAIKYNLSYIPSVMSQRDVPGITKAILPILINNNISALSIGSNDGSTPPNVPKIFKWKSLNNKYLITMLHPYGYGGVNISDAVLINNFSTAFVAAFKSDNKGPPTVEETLNYYNTLKNEFPNANIISTSFDEYINLLLDDKNKNIVNSLPVIDQEMGDTWAWGISSDPMKNILFRIAMRKRNNCLNDKLCNLNSIAFYNFSRFLLKSGEHTWGGGITHFLTLPDNYYAWSNKEFEYKLNDQNNETNEMIKLRKSWYEQRDLGLIYALQALSLSNDINDINLYNSIMSEWNQVYESQSPLHPMNDWNIIDSSKSYNIMMDNHIFELQFDDKTGAISRLYDMNTSINYADVTDDNLLGEFIYQSLNEMDYMKYMNEYVPDNKHPKPWKDESKIGIEEFGAAEHQYITATLVNLYRNKYNNLQFVTQLSFDGYSAHLHEYYGGPTNIYNFINFDNNITNSISFDMEITWINKTATRLPESIWFKFNPLKCSNWSVNKLNQDIYLSNIMNGGALHFMDTTGNVTCRINQQNMNKPFKILSIDAPGIGFISQGQNELLALPTPFVNISQDKGCGFCLYNNLWGTNYIMWFPYDEKEANITHRFRFYL